jgi:hypothetical protein
MMKLDHLRKILNKTIEFQKFFRKEKLVKKCLHKDGNSIYSTKESK